MIDTEQMMTLGQAARALRIAPGNVARHVALGHIRYIQTPLGRLYAREDIERLRRERARRRRRREAAGER